MAVCLWVICHFNIYLCLKWKQISLLIRSNVACATHQSSSGWSRFFFWDWDIKDRLLIIIIQPAGTSNKICFSFHSFFIHPLIFFFFSLWDFSLYRFRGFGCEPSMGILLTQLPLSGYHGEQSELYFTLNDTCWIVLSATLVFLSEEKVLQSFVALRAVFELDLFDSRVLC